MARPHASVDSAEVERFARHAGDWWTPRGPMAALHKFNPVRLAYIRDQAAARFERDARKLDCLAGLRMLDIGCGGGILSEPLARLGAQMVGADPAEENIEAARAHAQASGVAVDYRAITAEELAEAGERFDVVLAMEVVEHVADPAAFVNAVAKRLAPGGLLVMSTPNATALSRLMMIVVGEGFGQIPKGTHDFDKFIGPDRMKGLLGAAGLKCLDVQGIAWSPTRGLHLSDDLRLNYLISAVRP